MTEVQKHEDLKQYAIFSYGKRKSIKLIYLRQATILCKILKSKKILQDLILFLYMENKIQYLA